MPELPEVETTLRGISPHISGKTVVQTSVHQPKLRWPIPEHLADTLNGQTVIRCERRAKYLLVYFQTGILLIHLGMSGSLRIFTRDAAPDAGKHDHVDILFHDGTLLRYHDPRRFGTLLWFAGAAEHHPLLAKLGPEPLTENFNADYLHHALQKRKCAVKLAIMDNALVVGVGNIYANESLFRAAISPERTANKVNRKEAEKLCRHIKAVLQRAIDTGGSTLRDFVDSEGNSGYFQQEYAVYGRHNQPCRQCGTPIVKTVIGQRGTFYCPNCQK
ncbi:MAG: bifunctional DNA-formamidopyrimidine glycosylase/DNA-(apurinic or apyrimidinic site) lyase [Neisseria sp.]|uniref:bifunctional DNA-formamidopyrimidine glycosylase/DNA-(apurinic or apyrimidinic site) lyase n=1 Tax=Neisseria sp. TaxID=192066 RepID=UPI0026DACF7C|nr:bifunctional DNA-formamidopyrimidine glycosylase/DNA-(apurinic or apyrimidinic site) lyase [Neisseria sp.]MDO4640577.1 bifunctional DNA-formamidopyrimidine glycosylase/DNA-(apurinic or apyrimidinic site) lyase [Neisseria sp.]